MQIRAELALSDAKTPAGSLTRRKWPPSACVFLRFVCQTVGLKSPKSSPQMQSLESPRQRGQCSPLPHNNPVLVACWHWAEFDLSCQSPVPLSLGRRQSATLISQCLVAAKTVPASALSANPCDKQQLSVSPDTGR